jgi:hypothetical protein
MRQRILTAGETEGALKRTNHRTGPVGWKGDTATLAGSLHEEHGRKVRQRGNMTITVRQSNRFQELTADYGDSEIFPHSCRVCRLVLDATK